MQATGLLSRGWLSQNGYARARAPVAPATRSDPIQLGCASWRRDPGQTMRGPFEKWPPDRCIWLTIGEGVALKQIFVQVCLSCGA